MFAIWDEKKADQFLVWKFKDGITCVTVYWHQNWSLFFLSTNHSDPNWNPLRSIFIAEAAKMVEKSFSVVCCQLIVTISPFLRVKEGYSRSGILNLCYAYNTDDTWVRFPSAPVVDTLLAVHIKNNKIVIIFL